MKKYPVLAVFLKGTQSVKINNKWVFTGDVPKDNYPFTRFSFTTDSSEGSKEFKNAAANAVLDIVDPISLKYLHSMHCGYEW